MGFDVDFKVCVRCSTYNHANYIVDAMNGFTMQETTFPFICTIIDDASTDGEQGVIRNYYEEHFDFEDKNIAKIEETNDYVLSFARHRNNHNCYFAVLYLKYNHYRINKTKIKWTYVAAWNDRAKYISLCEGDDFWIDPYKLQKQVEILEKNPEVGLVHTNCYYVDLEGKTIPSDLLNQSYRDRRPFDSYGYIYGRLFNSSSSILTCTTVCRSKYIKERIGSLDHGIFMTAAMDKKIYFLEDYTSSYRVNPKGMMLSLSNVVEKGLLDSISSHMFNYYLGDHDNINKVYFTNNDLRNEVDVFFSKYLLHCIKCGCDKNTLSKIKQAIGRNKRLLIKLPILMIAWLFKKARI